MSIPNHGLCPDCKVRLLPRVSTGHGKTYRCDESWCPGCGKDWIAKSDPAPTPNLVVLGPRPNPTAPPPPTIGTEATGVRYQLRLQPDALVELRIGKLGPWLLSEEQIRDLERALGLMATNSRDRRAHLRGADRWAFRRDGERFFVKIHDQEATLAAYTVGAQRSTYSQGFTCAACPARLVKGSRAYKPVKWSSTWHVRWSEVRFCEACVSDTVQARVSKGLRVIDGGEGKAR